MKAERFIIICPARSGSTMLRMMIREHSKIECKGEIIVPHKVNRGESLEYFQDNVFEKKGVSGFKFKYMQFLIQYPEVREEIIKSKDIKIIHLVRKNLIKRFISQKIAGHTDTTLIFEAGKVPEQIGHKIDFVRLIEDIEKHEEEEEKIRKIFKGHKVFTVYYEDFYPVINKKVSKNLQEFFGVEPINLKPTTKKINSDALKDIIINYKEIREKLSNNTKYRKYLKYLD